MPTNLENSAAATGLEKVSFHSNPKEGQRQRMFKLLHNCSHFTCQQGHAQNPPSQDSIVYEPRTCRYTSWIQKRQEEPEIKLPTSIGSQKVPRVSGKTLSNGSTTHSGSPTPSTPSDLKNNRGNFQGMFRKIPVEKTIVPGCDNTIRMPAVGLSLTSYRTLEP